jgi:hypothetical protein
MHSHRREKKRATALLTHPSSRCPALSYLSAAGSGKGEQCKQSNLGKKSFLFLYARERLLHATTLAFRFYILKMFGYSQDILKIFGILKIFESNRIKKPAWTSLPSVRSNGGIFIM